MANLRVLVPQATTNYIKNPALRRDTTGYVAVGSTISRSLERARFGIASLKIITNASSISEGAFYRVNDLQGISDFITVSVYVRGSGIVRVRLIDNPNGKQFASVPVTLTDNRWKRIEVSGRCTGSNDVRLYVETYKSSPQAVTFYADGFQMEPLPFSTTYCDGDQPGSRWNLIAHQSKSTRIGTTRAGGRWVDLAGPCREDDDIYVTGLGGFGMAPIKNSVQDFAIQPGGFLQSSKILSRPLTLSFHTKHKKLITRGKPKLDALHELRQQLIDIFKPDLTAGDESFRFQYDEGDKILYIDMRYEGGLEGDWDIRNQWTNSFPVRFLALSPLWYEDDQEVSPLGFINTLPILSSVTYPSGSQVMGRIKGVWTLMPDTDTGGGAGGDLEVSADGTLYCSGGPRVRYWDGNQWTTFGRVTGSTASINDMAVASNGFVYIAGGFTGVNGVAANNVAYWDGLAWHAMGTGLNNFGVQVAVAPNGDLYCGGSFTTAGGITTQGIARWNGSQWFAVGPLGGLNGTVNSIVISPDGNTIYMCGNFSDQRTLAASALLRVCKYTVSSGLFSALGGGINATGLEVVLDKDGTLYVSGDFTSAGGGITANHIASWNGSIWIQLGNGTNGTTIFTMDILKDGSVIASGTFTTAGDVPADKIAEWNGSAWVPMDIIVARGGSPSILSILAHPNGDLYIGGSFNATSISTVTSKITSILNTGSTSVFPIIYVFGPGILKWIENQTTGEVVHLNLSILDDEEVFIDFGKGTIKSTIRGDLSFSILQGSNFRSFSLLPGANDIAVFMTDDVQSAMQISYIPSHWSADAVKNAEAL